MTYKFLICNDLSAKHNLSPYFTDNQAGNKYRLAPIEKFFADDTDKKRRVSHP